MKSGNCRLTASSMTSRACRSRWSSSGEITTLGGDPQIVGNQQQRLDLQHRALKPAVELCLLELHVAQVGDVQSVAQRLEQREILQPRVDQLEPSRGLTAIRAVRLIR